MAGPYFHWRSARVLQPLLVSFKLLKASRTFGFTFGNIQRLSMKTHNLGYPRIGSNRELKWASEKYWSGKISLEELLTAAKGVRAHNWQLQKAAGIDIIPSNDFSYYDQVLDMTLTVGAIPERYHDFEGSGGKFADLDLYFAMARGYQRDKIDVPAMEMLKWFDTNYHYIVPEFKKAQQFKLNSTKIISEFDEAKALGIVTKPVIIGPVSYLMLGKEKEPGFHRISLLEKLLPIYVEVLKQLEAHGAEWIQLDEPYLALDLDSSIKAAYKQAYAALHNATPKVRILVATYFDRIGDNLDIAAALPVQALHIDLVRSPNQLDDVLAALPASMILSVGVVDGRNVWKNDFGPSLGFIRKAVAKLGSNDRVLIAPSCSLQLSPCDLASEHNEQVLSSSIKNWMAFARQKIDELATLAKLAVEADYSTAPAFKTNQEAHAQRKSSPLIHKAAVQQRIAQLTEKDVSRGKPFSERKQLQQQALHLPVFPTTTIGSFPQTAEVRQWRAQWRKGEMSQEQYDKHIKEAIEKAIRWQENIGLDVLVHGEFERTDMVEYFGEQLQGFTFTQNGWVQSYGSRCVKPPVIFGDVERTAPMTVYYTQYAQSLTPKPVKGMLTGPVTILQWSFVRNDQPRSDTCLQIACAIRDEVKDLETAGTKVIQIDEPAIREGLPLRKVDWSTYLDWAVRAFRISSASVRPETQIHTHMCYSEFNDIIHSIADMDADVITIETSRSQMKLLQAFGDFRYPNDIGPGVYDIHSPRVPHLSELLNLMHMAEKVIPPAQLWVNPDCGLKTRGWDETEASLKEMVEAARTLRKEVKQ